MTINKILFHTVHNINSDSNYNYKTLVTISCRDIGWCRGCDSAFTVTDGWQMQVMTIDQSYAEVIEAWNESNRLSFFKKSSRLRHLTDSIITSL